MKLSALLGEDKRHVKNKDQSPAPALGALFTGFLSSTTAHGLPRVITEPSIIRRFAWLVIFVGATALFCLMMYYSLVEFYTRPVDIHIKYKTRMEAEFPAVTVCNLNPLKKSKLVGTAYEALKTIDETYAQYLMNSGSVQGQNWKSGPTSQNGQSSSSGSTALQAAMSAMSAMSAQGTSGDFQLQNSDFMMNAASDTDFVSFMEYSQTDDYSDIFDLLKPTQESFDAYGHQAQDLILQCSFDKTNCSYLDFTKVYNSRYGNCFVFNLNATTTTLYGSNYGLRLTLNVEPDDYVGLLSHEVGVRIAVHAANVTAFPEDEGVNAPTKFATSIGVTTSTFQRLPDPYASMCADSSNHTLLDSGEYTVWSCMLACLQCSLKNECGCSDRVGLSSTETMCSLTNATQEVCRQATYALFKKGKLDCYCPPSCNQVQYKSKVSMTTWPSASYIPILWDKIGGDLQTLGYTTVEDAQEAMVRVHVYMEDLTVHCMEEHAAFTLEDLFANMGGYLGLFIGISACTVMEFFEFLLDAMGYAVITICGGSFVRCVQQTKKKNGLPLSSIPEHTVKLPPSEPIHNSKTRILIVESTPDAQEESLGVKVLVPCQLTNA